MFAPARGCSTVGRARSAGRCRRGGCACSPRTSRTAAPPPAAPRTGTAPSAGRTARCPHTIFACKIFQIRYVFVPDRAPAVAVARAAACGREAPVVDHADVAAVTRDARPTLATKIFLRNDKNIFSERHLSPAGLGVAGLAEGADGVAVAGVAAGAAVDVPVGVAAAKNISVKH